MPAGTAQVIAGLGASRQENAESHEGFQGPPAGRLAATAGRLADFPGNEIGLHEAAQQIVQDLFKVHVRLPLTPPCPGRTIVPIARHLVGTLPMLRAAVLCLLLAASGAAGSDCYPPPCYAPPAYRRVVRYRTVREHYQVQVCYYDCYGRPYYVWEDRCRSRRVPYTVYVRYYPDEDDD
jgi:hypothetical protein